MPGAERRARSISTGRWVGDVVFILIMTGSFYVADKASLNLALEGTNLIETELFSAWQR